MNNISPSPSNSNINNLFNNNFNISICILRLSAIGDICMSLPAINAIKAKYPQAKITWIIGKNEAKLYGDIKDIEFIIFDKKNSLKELFKLKRILKNRYFDILLHMQPTLRANIISLVIKAKLKLGFHKDNAKEYQHIFTNVRLNKLENYHYLDGFLEFAKYLGCDDIRFKYDIPLSKADIQFATNNIKQKTIVINACSSPSFIYRNWRADKFAKLIDKCIKDFDYKIVLVGGNSDIEKDMAKQIVRLSNYKIKNLVAKTTLKQLLALIKKAQLVLSVDSAPVHLAEAVNTKIIGLYAATNPNQTGPYKNKDMCINHYPKNLKWGTRLKTNIMHTIEVDEVITKISKI